MSRDNMRKVRTGCKDTFHASMVKDATSAEHDIPYCPTTATNLPAILLTYDEAKAIYNRQIKRGNKNFLHIAFVCFYMDDYKFDGKNGIWQNYRLALNVLNHFSGVITPDFSTYQDFPKPLKLYNTYRMRAFGYWLGKMRTCRNQ